MKDEVTEDVNYQIKIMSRDSFEKEAMKNKKKSFLFVIFRD